MRTSTSRYDHLGSQDEGSSTAQARRLRRAPNPTHASDQRRRRECILPTFSHVWGVQTVQKNVGEVTVSEVDFFEVCCSIGRALTTY